MVNMFSYNIMSLSVDDLEITNKNCQSHNIVWENKGIVLGILNFLVDNYQNIKKKRIIINHRKTRYLIRKLFPKLSIIKKGKKDDFWINIRTIVKPKYGLVINHIDNLDKINAKEVYLIPYYDPDNPIIMYIHSGKNVLKRDKIETKIKKFTECERGKEYGTSNYITRMCKIQTWDPYMEYEILVKYLRGNYRGITLETLYEYISKHIMDDMCLVPKIERVAVPINIPIKITKEVTKEVPVEIIKEVIKEVPVIKEVIKEVPHGSAEHFEELVDAMADKLAVLNDMYDIARI